MTNELTEDRCAHILNDVDNLSYRSHSNSIYKLSFYNIFFFFNIHSIFHEIKKNMSMIYDRNNDRKNKQETDKTPEHKT